MRANGDIRQALQDAGLCQWMLAEKLKVTEWTLCRKMRRELPTAEKTKIFAAIEQIQNERPTSE